MLAYAASRPAIATRRSSPNALLIIIGAHIALLAAVMSAKMDLPARILHSPIEVTWIPLPKNPPPPHPVRAAAPQPTPQFTFEPPQTQINMPSVSKQIVDSTSSLPNISQLIGPSVVIEPIAVPKPSVRTEAQLLTPPSELKPPYPSSKLSAEEEAVLKLRLTIDPRGFVVAVDPVGSADPIFFAAARQHLIAHWRYKPASEGGQSVASTILITLRFQLDN